MRRQAKAASATSISGQAKGCARLPVAGLCLLTLLAFAGSSASLAPQAHASLGGSRIVNFWGNEGNNGSFEGGGFGNDFPMGVAVNDATGDVFVTDTGRHRIQQFDGEGNFIRAWGEDVIVNTGTRPNSNGTGFEVCDTTTDPPNIASHCKQGVNTASTGGALSSPGGLAVDQRNGRLYVVDRGLNRIQVFRFDDDNDPNNAPLTSETDDDQPRFVRAIGQDVVSGSGGENRPATSSVQSLGIPPEVTGGTYTLSFRGQTSVALEHDAPAIGGTNPSDSVENALRALGTIGAAGVNVSGTGPYTITFTGPLANAPMAPISVDSTNLVGGNASITTTTQGSTGYEICTVAVSCKAGTTTGGAAGALQDAGFPAIAPEDAPNEGNLLVPNVGKQRIEEFSPTGEFVRSFGWDVVSSPPDEATTFEVCSAATFDVCKIGTTGRNAGQFYFTNASGAGPLTPSAGVAEARDGSIYTVEPTGTVSGSPPLATNGFRVQKFTLTGGNVVAAHGTFACDLLCGTSTAAGEGAKADNTSALAVDDSGFLYALKAFPQGTGEPPAVTPLGFLSPLFQRRILKIDPATEEVVDTYLANPGKFNAFETLPATAKAVDYLSAIAVGGTGAVLYAANATVGTSHTITRVYRLGDIEGFAATDVAAEAGMTTATATATITVPTSMPLSTRYRFEYTRAGAEEWNQFRVPDPQSPIDVGADIGNGSDGGESTDCSRENPARVCHVEQLIDGLTPDSGYELRLVVTTEANGLLYVSDPVQFETSKRAPQASTGAAVWSGPAERDPTLTFNGTVNPQGAQTRFSFEYGTEGPCSNPENQCELAPEYGSDIGHGGVMLAVNATVADISSARPVHYRIVASSEEGVMYGEDRVVEPPRSGERFIELVSDGDSFGSGVVVNKELVVSDDGLRVGFAALAFGEQPSAGLLNPSISQRGSSRWEVVSVRPPAGQPLIESGPVNTGMDAAVTKALWGVRTSPTSARWIASGIDGETVAMSPELTPLLSAGGGVSNYLYRGMSADLSTIVFAGNYAGNVGRSLLADEPLVTGGFSNLYAIAGAGSQGADVHVVNRGTDNGVIGGGCGARLGEMRAEKSEQGNRSRAVSTDGSVIYFSARPGAPVGSCVATGNPVRIFKREDNAATTVVSACAKSDPGSCTEVGDDRFLGASADGDTVVFTTTRQLVDSDTDTGGVCSDDPFSASESHGCDLYLYDSNPVAGPNLVQVSAGELVEGEGPGDPPAHEVGFGARVLGVIGLSMDGSRVYFVATGRLTEEAKEGAKNLFVYERSAAAPNGRIDFIAELSPKRRLGTGFYRADEHLWSGESWGQPAHVLPLRQREGAETVAGDGRYLVFLSEAPLLARDGDSTFDVYRYDDLAHSLTCLSCDVDNSRPASISSSLSHSVIGVASTAQLERIASEDISSIVFTTAAELLPGDSNGTKDAYVWQMGAGAQECMELNADTYSASAEGCLSLVTGASGALGVLAGGRGYGGSAVAATPTISADGKSVFFATRATILPGDINNGAVDWYVARTGGGFPQKAGTSDPCAEIGDLCKGPDPAAQPSSPPVGSAQFRGEGNLSASPPPCGQAQVRRRSRCLSKAAVIRRACAMRRGKAKRRCIRRQARRLNTAQARRNRANHNRRASR